MIGCRIGVLLCMFCILVVLLVRGVHNNPEHEERSLCTLRRLPPTPYEEIEKKGLSCATNTGESHCVVISHLIYFLFLNVVFMLYSLIRFELYINVVYYAGERHKHVCSLLEMMNVMGEVTTTHRRKLPRDTQRTHSSLPQQWHL